MISLMASLDLFFLARGVHSTPFVCALWFMLIVVVLKRVCYMVSLLLFSRAGSYLRRFFFFFAVVAVIWHAPLTRCCFTKDGNQNVCASVVCLAFVWCLSGVVSVWCFYGVFLEVSRHLSVAFLVSVGPIVFRAELCSKIAGNAVTGFHSKREADAPAAL